MCKTLHFTSHFQRKLVGEALKPAALSNVVPLLQEGADKAVDKILSSSGAVTIVEICKKYSYSGQNPILNSCFRKKMF